MGVLAASLSLVLALQSAAGSVGVRREGDRLVVTRRVMFVRGHVEHVAASRAVVDAMAAYLRGQTGIEIVVEGHSDIGGDEAENVRLSQARAAFVAQGLRRRGVTATIHAVGRGSAEPLVAADHPELWRNRRIEVRVVAVAETPAKTTPLLTTLDDNAVAPRSVASPAIVLLDDEGVASLAPALPLLDAAPAGAPAPRLTAVDDDDLLPVSFAAMPQIALLDDEPQIGLVE